MLKHVEDDGDLSFFIGDNGEIAIVCKKGHQWVLPSSAVRKVTHDATDAVSDAMGSADVFMGAAKDAYPDAF